MPIITRTITTRPTLVVLFSDQQCANRRRRNYAVFSQTVPSQYCQYVGIMVFGMRPPIIDLVQFARNEPRKYLKKKQILNTGY